MNRVIKFRTWDIERKSFIYSDKRDLETQLFRLYDFLKECFKLGHYDVSLQQFTGCFDKNKRDIYEGDIVKTDPEHISLILRSNENCPEYTHGQIKWLCEAWKVCQGGIGAAYMGDYSTCGCCPCGLEIIGNIFENPELLK
jgi:uncharacterized phage protein (TIGR01671 family)